MAFTGAMPSDKPAMPQSFLMIGAFPQGNGQIMAEFRVSALDEAPSPGAAFTYEGKLFIVTEVTQDYSRRECIAKAIHYPNIDAYSEPEYDDIKVRDKNGDTVAVVRTEKPSIQQWAKDMLRPSFMERRAKQGGLTDAAEYNAQMGTGYAAILADAARQKKEQIRMQQERFSQRANEEFMKRMGLMVKPPAPTPKPAPKPKPDPFPTAKRIIKLQD
jgi:hypothetical protein